MAKTEPTIDLQEAVADLQRYCRCNIDFTYAAPKTMRGMHGEVIVARGMGEMTFRIEAFKTSGRILIEDTGIEGLQAAIDYVKRR